MLPICFVVVAGLNTVSIVLKMTLNRVSNTLSNTATLSQDPGNEVVLPVSVTHNALIEPVKRVIIYRFKPA